MSTTIEAQLRQFSTLMGTEVKELINKIGVLSNLSTSEKTSLVTALNEVKAAVSQLETAQAGAVGINDDASESSTTETYSVKKVNDLILAKINEVKTDILDSAPEALNTLKELATALGENANFSADMAASLGKRVRFDEAQSLEDSQKIQARSNIDAAKAQELEELKNSVGNIGDLNLTTIYNEAKNG